MIGIGKVMFSNIEETLDYIYSFANLEKTKQNQPGYSKHYSLDNIINICRHLGNPEQHLRFIHIAGTKGKGSTSLFTTRLLLECGYNTLTFTSPHLIRPNERIQYNMMPIPDSSLIEITNDIKGVLEKNNLTPTTFELLFLIALFYGLRRDVDYFVIETGLGGRLDCTNIITPEVSAITTIGYDHVDILGKTIKKISYEKAGIIKPTIPVVIASQHHKCCNRYFKKIAHKKNSNLSLVDNLYKVGNIKYSCNGVEFDFCRKGMSKSTFSLPCYGKHQIYNFLTALEIVTHINNTIIDHLKLYPTIDLRIPGRVEQVKESPLVIVDVAHNKESIQALVNTLKKHFSNKKWTVLFSLSDDKDAIAVCKLLPAIANKIIITTLSEYKTCDTKKLQKLLSKRCNNTIVVENQNQAFSLAMKEDNLLVTGSFYLAGPFLEWISQK